MLFFKSRKSGVIYMKEDIKKKEKRAAGILLPVSSLPGPYGIGELGKWAEYFVNWLREGGVQSWSILPLNPTSFGNSPYQSPSAFAGSINYISLETLYADGLLKREDLEGIEGTAEDVDYGKLFAERPIVLKKAFRRFAAKGGLIDNAYLQFCKSNVFWLDDYAAFMAIKERMGYRPWWQWPQELAYRRNPEYMSYLEQITGDVEFWKFTQFIFFNQWSKLKKYANDRGVMIIGDMPFYVAPDSADVWGRKELFAVNPETGRIEMWAGVPADMFSDHDRNWGNPVYRWENHKGEDYKWFRERISICGSMYDTLRIDHVIAIKRYFGIRDGETTGTWYDGPESEDRSFSDAICQEAERKQLSIIAEDLGKVPPGLRERIKENSWGSMRVLQFGYTGKYGAKSHHLPFFHEKDMVVYTGTHDHPTLKEFLDQKTEEELRYMMWWTRKNTREELRWALIEEAYKSPARQVIIPLQDILGLGEEARMVFPMDYERSWKWRIPNSTMLSSEIAGKMKRLAVLTGRSETETEQEFFNYL